MEYILAKLNTPMPPTLAQGRKIIQEIIHFYPEMQEKISEFKNEYISKIEEEYDGMYDMES